MENDLENKRQAAYQASDETTKDLYASIALGEILFYYTDKLTLAGEKQHEFINIVGDIILGLYPKAELSKKLTDELGIGQDVANEISGKLAEVLTTVPDLPTLPSAESSLREKLELRPEGVPAGEQMTQPLTREELLNALSSKRTMASDAARVQGAPVAGAATVGYQNYKPPTESTPGQ